MITNKLIISALGALFLIVSLVIMFTNPESAGRKSQQRRHWATYGFVAGMALVAASWFI